MTTFYLVRHGLTNHTNHRLSGRMAGIHLNDDGRAQAEAVGKRLSRVDLEAVYASPLERTVETARAVAAPHRLKVTTRKALIEVDYGTWTGRPLRSLARTKLWRAVQHRPSAARFPEGESLMEVQSRAVAELERIQANHPKGKVCIVSHGDVIRLLLAHHLGTHVDLFQRIHVGAASMSVLALGATGPHVLAVNIGASEDG